MYLDVEPALSIRKKKRKKKKSRDNSTHKICKIQEYIYLKAADVGAGI